MLFKLGLRVVCYMPFAAAPSLHALHLSYNRRLFSHVFLIRPRIKVGIKNQRG
jgi:hypothetical protein